MYPEPFPYSLWPSSIGMIFDERLIWVPHLKSLRLAYHSPLDLLHHLSHTTWGADRTTLLRLYRILVRSKLGYGAYFYCLFVFFF